MIFTVCDADADGVVHKTLSDHVFSERVRSAIATADGLEGFKRALREAHLTLPGHVEPLLNVSTDGCELVVARAPAAS